MGWKIIVNHFDLIGNSGSRTRSWGNQGGKNLCIDGGGELKNSCVYNKEIIVIFVFRGRAFICSDLVVNGTYAKIVQHPKKLINLHLKKYIGPIHY